MNPNGNDNQSKALASAWQHYAELDAHARATSRQHLRLHAWGIGLAVTATLLSIVTERYGGSGATDAGRILRAFMVLAPIAGFIVLAFANQYRQGERWLVLRSGAEEILKEIYLYRTLLQGREGRDQWINEKVSVILRRMFEAAGGNLAARTDSTNNPPHYDPADPNSDPGFSDLLADDYIRYRLDGQLNSHVAELMAMEKSRTRWLVAIFSLGGLSVFLAAMGGSLTAWVAFTTSMTLAFTGWLELRRLESSLNTHGELTLHLKILRDYWQSLSQEARTGDAFLKLVTAAEDVLWSEHQSCVSQMRRAVANLQGANDDLLTQTLHMPASAALDESLAKVEIAKTAAPSQADAATPAETTTAPPDAGAVATFKSRKGLPHAFVVMPFGRKQGPDERWIDFNAIYHNLIKPALEEAGFEAFRADEESVSGDILTDMFQELLLADLVLADLSIDNANVFYELGVRHSLRKRGLIHIQAGRSYMPFDIFNVRTISYHCDANGRPDSEHVEKDKQAIVKIARETWASDQDRVHSPVFNLLSGLTEPDRKSLRTPLATGYWREYNEWHDRVTIAQRQKRIGDVLLLTEEVKNPLIREEAIAEAGRALKSMGRSELALQQYRRGIELNPRNLEFRREEAFHLNRLKQSDEAIVKLEKVLRDNPGDIETITYLGTIYRGIWESEWNGVRDGKERIRRAYESSHWLKKAIEMYLSGYRLDHDHTYSGINAYILSALLDHLAREGASDSDPEIRALRQQLAGLRGAVQVALNDIVQRDPSDYWALISIGLLAISTVTDPDVVTRAYKKALTAARKNIFNLESSLGLLEVLHALNYRPEPLAAGMTVLRDELKRCREEEESQELAVQKPPRVFLFSGHMIDLPGREDVRFPTGMENEARERIEAAIDKFHADENDLAIIGGAACGGDLLFIEACLQRKMNVEVLLPFGEAEFIKESVSFAGDAWVERFYNARNHQDLTIHLQPDRVGPARSDDNPYERNNRWALYSALIYGIDRLRLIVLWDGKAGFGPGGTAHMVQEVRRLGGIVEHLNTTKFDYWKAKGKVGRALDILAKG
ncbi:MAG: tetratricopeptide repeat-containing protein [Chloroflexota bacterium]